MKKLGILFFVLTISTAANAQVKKWTLSECVQYALDNNISVKQSELDLAATDIEKMSATGAFLPSLNFSTSASENTGLSFNPLTNNAQTTTFLSVNGSVNVGYTLFDGLRNYRRVQRAALSQLSSQYRLSKMKDDISLFVANGYLQVLLNKANVAAVVAQNQVTKQQIERTKKLIDAGVLPRGDLLEIDATDASEQQRIAVADNAVRISLISLAQLLLIKDYENFDIVDEDYQVVNNAIALKSVDEIIEGAKQTRSEVKIAEQNVSISEKDLQIAKGASLPTLSAFFGYNSRYTNAGSFTQDLDPDNPFITQEIGVVEQTGQSVVGQFPNTISREVQPDAFLDQAYENDGISYGLQLSIPVFNAFSVRANVRRSKISLERSKLQLQQAALDLESNVYQAYVDAEGSRKAYQAAQKSVASQELAYQYAKDRYDAGATNAFDFSQSKLRYDNAQVELNRSKYDYIFKIKVLELYFGIPATELKF
ncbi:TolC family protein [Flavobacteriaceae bacterium]|nr:TolC family protein [Flavobacteriaceae bacterium]MDB4176102.1 TolC family protein [Flavobacteriaceae bacterium]MDB4280199.1 TolC family protein [Flavobacteriaceae bacterium]